MLNQQFNGSLLDPFPPPIGSQRNGTSRKLEIIVVFTSLEATKTAMDHATALLRGLNGHISLIDVQTVPRQLPLERPPISLTFMKRRLLSIAYASLVDTTAYVYLCRSRFETLEWVLKAGALIVIGCRSKWWPTWETKLSRGLRRAGYQVILHESPKSWLSRDG